MFIVATGARESAVSGFSLGISDRDGMLHDVQQTTKAANSKMGE